MIPFSIIGEVLEKVKTLTDFVIIGDTIVDISLGRKGTESDVDIFTLSISPIFEEDRIREFAYKNGWDFGKTPIDTPRIIANFDDYEIQIDFYENFQDFYVPQKIIDNSIIIKIDNKEFKSVRLEDYILLKANAFREEDEDELRTIVYLVSEGKLKIDVQYLWSNVDLFEENAKSIRDRLIIVGIRPKE
ncbi:MAG: nucleotidyltransferase [Sulfolobaceae archaeon]